MGIRTIIFDIGRTLVPFSFVELEARIEPCRARALELFTQAEIGAVTPAEFQQRACGMLAMSEAEFGPWWNSIFDHRWLIAPELIRDLMAQYRVGLISNTNAAHFDYLRTHWPLLGEVDFQILSHVVGAAKPDARIYAAAEEQAECLPGEILYWDDVAAFVEAARRRGWQAERFEGPESVAAGLAKHQIQRAANPRATGSRAETASRENDSPSVPGT